MPTVEKVRGSRVTIRDVGTFAQGDRAGVSTADAQYLCDERGDFKRVNDEDAEFCSVVKKSDGEVCGRECPCPYHDDTSEG